MQNPALWSHERDCAIINGVRIELDAIVEPSSLKQTSTLRNAFARNAPFPHLVIDGLFSPVLLELVRDEFASLPRSDWRKYNSAGEIKRGSIIGARFGPATQLYFNTIHSHEFMQFLAEVTGIEGLIADPQLKGGGMHEIPDGGHFAAHIDFNRHPVTGLYNRLVMITYLNADWQHSYGGSLELWNCETNVKAIEIDPVFGRTVMFAQTPHSLHGHSVPVRTPDRRTRRSVAAYFYTQEAAAGLGGELRTTRFAVQPKPRLRDFAKRYVKYVTPPVLIDVARRVLAAIAHPK
jgi:hypothetical protein